MPTTATITRVERNKDRTATLVLSSRRTLCVENPPRNLEAAEGTTLVIDAGSVIVNGQRWADVIATTTHVINGDGFSVRVGGRIRLVDRNASPRKRSFK